MARTIGASLKAARESRGLTLRQVAKATGLAIPQISALEGGRPANPGWATVVKVAKAIGFSLDEAAGIRASKIPAGSTIAKAKLMPVLQRARRAAEAALTAVDDTIDKMD